MKKFRHTSPPKWRAIRREGKRRRATGYPGGKWRYPKVGQTVIVWFDMCGIDLMCYRGAGCFTSCLGFLTDDVTHWIPLSKMVQDELRKRKYAGKGA